VLFFLVILRAQSRKKELDLIDFKFFLVKRAEKDVCFMSDFFQIIGSSNMKDLV
jgi:hypothetical protein